MKIIFLDIDGVLCNQLQWNVKISGCAKTGLHHFDQKCVKLLNDFIVKNDCKIVISSTWRNLGIEKLKEHFLEENVVGEIIDVTPNLNIKGMDSIQRGQEIRDWLNNHPEVKSFVIFDDNSDMKSVTENFIWTLWMEPETGQCIEGLLETHIEKAQAILDKSNKA